MGFMFGLRRPVSPEMLPPAGRIKSREELQDLIIEARKERKAIRIYLVEQSGHLTEFFITSKSRLNKPENEDGFCSGDRFYKVDGRKLASWERRKAPKHRYYPSHIFCGSYAIGAPAHDGAPHYAFTNRQLAERYSLYLKAHKEYQQYVKAWHAYVDESFRSF